MTRLRSNSAAETPSCRAKALTAKYSQKRADLTEELHPTGIVVIKNRYRTLSQVQEYQNYQEQCPSLGQPSSPSAISSALQLIRPRAMSLDLEAIQSCYHGSAAASPTLSASKQKERDLKEFLLESGSASCNSTPRASAARAWSPQSYGHGSAAIASSNLHQLCGSPFPSLELVRMTLQLSPYAVRERDNSGNMPIHVSVNRDDPVMLVVRELLKIYPNGAKIRDANGNLPLFLACRRPKVSAGIIKALLQVYPEAARVRIYGNLALHHLVHTGSASPECIRLLLEVFPEAATVANKQGNLPLHYLCASNNPNLDSVRILMNAHPDGITALNNDGETPITRALSIVKKDTSASIVGTIQGGGRKGCSEGPSGHDGECWIESEAADAEKLRRRERVRLLLLASRQEALNCEQKQLLCDLNWEARRPAMLICSAVLRAYRNSEEEAVRRNPSDGANFADSSSVTKEETKEEPRKITFQNTICGSEDVWRTILKFL